MTSPWQRPAGADQHESGKLLLNLRRPRALLVIVATAALIAAGMTHFIATVADLGELGSDGVLVLRLLLAIGLIIAVGWLGGMIAKCGGQPRVVGEMVAGIALGPSLLGQFMPGVAQWVFPAELIPHLGFIAQMVIVVFVFLLGANLPLGLLRGSGRRVVIVGVGMLALPTICGILLAGGLAGMYRPAGVALIPFVLFIGVSMGVTAFPVLVRILAEHRLVRSRIGTLGLTAAGIGDAIAWCLLILVVALHGGTAAAVLSTTALLVVFVVVVWLAYRPALRYLMAFAEKNSRARACSTPLLLLSAVSGASITEWIGVHAIFGAFLIGLAVPRENALVRDLNQGMERGICAVLPLFFAMVGVSVEIGVLNNLQDLLVCGLVIVVAITSKIGGTSLIARSTKLPWRESLGLGVMMNCRGLTELVVITTGFSLGIIGENLFAVFVVMTLVTTMMTGPLLGWLKLNKEGSSEEGSVRESPTAAATETNPAVTSA